MKRSMIFGGAVLASVSAAGKAVPDMPEQPNILCIVCEDIGPYLGCYGDPVSITPNIDSLAASGIRYSGMYTSIGVSAPSRFSLITGMYPSSCGANQMRNCTKVLKSMPEGILPYDVVLDEGIRCYTEYLREAGYYCTNNSKTDYQFRCPVSAWDECSPRAHWKNCPEGMPFFSIFNLAVTHESQIWKRGDKPLAVDPEDVPVPPYYPDDPVVRHDIAVMYSNIHEMDRQVGRLIDELKKAGKYDDTVIIWYSDNGGPLPRQKREVYESGAHVPFIVRFPDGFRKGETESRLAMFADVPATILSIAGIRPPGYMHGRAFLGKYERSPRKYVYGAHDRMDEQVDKIGAVSDGRFRYIRNYMTERSGYMPVAFRLQMPMMRRMVELDEEGKLNDVQGRWFRSPRPAEEFYVTEEDPHEICNRIYDPEYADEIRRLRKEYDRWIRRYNRDWFLTESQMREKMWPGGAQPKVETPEISVTSGKIVLKRMEKGVSYSYRINGKAYGKVGGWYLYTRPIKAAKGDSVTIVGSRIGYEDSEKVSITL